MTIFYTTEIHYDPRKWLYRYRVFLYQRVTDGVDILRDANGFPDVKNERMLGGVSTCTYMTHKGALRGARRFYRYRVRQDRKPWLVEKFHPESTIH